MDGWGKQRTSGKLGRVPPLLRDCTGQDGTVTNEP